MITRLHHLDFDHLGADMPLAIDLAERDGYTLLTVAGELDMSTAPELYAVLSRLIGSGQRRLLLDLAGLAFCDSAGLTVFVRTQQQLEGIDGRLVLAAPTTIVHRILDVSGLVEVFSVRDSVPDALAVLLADAAKD